MTDTRTCSRCIFTDCPQVAVRRAEARRQADQHAARVAEARRRDALVRADRFARV